VILSAVVLSAAGLLAVASGCAAAGQRAASGPRPGVTVERPATGSSASASSAPGSSASASSASGSAASASSASASSASASSASVSSASGSRLPGRHGDGGAAGLTLRRFTLPDGAVMTAATFTGDVRFVLHCGTLDPGSLCRGKGLAGQRVTPFERGRLIAAFNGGFKLSARAGGYEQEGTVLSPLRRGLASLVIYASGEASIGVWGYGEPRPGQRVYSVRQNLDLLVRDGKPTAAAAANWGYWGGTVTGVDNTARSAIGQNARGQLIYVASMSATPPDLAAALIRAGAVIGMELDINQEWVQFDYARAPGGGLVKAIADQWRPASQYLTGWTRDFIAVLAGWPAVPATGTRPVP